MKQFFQYRFLLYPILVLLAIGTIWTISDTSIIQAKSTDNYVLDAEPGLAVCGLALPAQQQSNSFVLWFGFLELPFLALCIFFAFRTANALKGGVFGAGMALMAWGFLVMGVGHLHLQFASLTGINIFNQLLGQAGGTTIWIIALIITWTLSGLGFYNIYRASRAG